MDKELVAWVISVNGVFLATIISLLVYIWRDRKNVVTNDQDKEVIQRSKDDDRLYDLLKNFEAKTRKDLDILYDLLKTFEAKTRKDLDILFRVASSNTENIKALIVEHRACKEACDIKRATCSGVTC